MSDLPSLGSSLMDDIQRLTQTLRLHGLSPTIAITFATVDDAEAVRAQVTRDLGPIFHVQTRFTDPRTVGYLCGVELRRPE